MPIPLYRYWRALALSLLLSLSVGQIGVAQSLSSWIDNVQTLELQAGRILNTLARIRLNYTIERAGTASDFAFTSSLLDQDLKAEILKLRQDMNAANAESIQHLQAALDRSRYNEYQWISAYSNILTELDNTFAAVLQGATSEMFDLHRSLVSVWSSLRFAWQQLPD